MKIDNLTWETWKLNFIKYLWLLVIGVLLSGISSFIFSQYMDHPIYTSSFEILFNESSTDSENQQGMKDAIPLVTTYLSVLNSDEVIQDVASSLHLDMTTDELRSQMKVESVNNSLVFKITYSDKLEKQAATIGESLATNINQKIPTIFPKINAYLVKKPTVVVEKKNSSRIIIAMTLSVVLYLMLIFLKCLLDRNIRSKEQIEALKISYLGDFPSLRKKQCIEWSKHHDIL